MINSSGSPSVQVQSIIKDDPRMTVFTFLLQTNDGPFPARFIIREEFYDDVPIVHDIEVGDYFELNNVVVLPHTEEFYGLYVSSMDQIYIHNKAVAKFRVKSPNTNNLYVAFGPKTSDIDVADAIELIESEDGIYEGEMVIPTDGGSFYYRFYNKVDENYYETAGPGSTVKKTRAASLWQSSSYILEDEIIDNWRHLNIPQYMYEGFANAKVNTRFRYLGIVCHLGGYDHIFVFDGLDESNPVIKVELPNIKTTDLESIGISVGTFILLTARKTGDNSAILITDETDIVVDDPIPVPLPSPFNLNTAPDLEAALLAKQGRTVNINNLEIIDIVNDPNREGFLIYQTKHSTDILFEVIIHESFLDDGTSVGYVELGDNILVYGAILYSEDGIHRLYLSSEEQWDIDFTLINIEFDTQLLGYTLPSQQIRHDAIPEEPTISPGMQSYFVRWYYYDPADPTEKVTYDFSYALGKSTTIYAEWDGI